MGTRAVGECFHSFLEFFQTFTSVSINLVSLAHYRNVRGLGKSMVVFRLFEKLRYSNERSTIF